MHRNDRRLRTSAVAISVAALTVASTLVGTSIVAAQEETTLQRIQREGIARVGFSNEAPFAYASAEGITGAAPEILPYVDRRQRRAPRTRQPIRQLQCSTNLRPQQQPNRAGQLQRIHCRRLEELPPPRSAAIQVDMYTTLN